MAPLLEVSHLTKVFYPTPSLSRMIRRGPRKSALRVLENVHLTLQEGDLYCLMGPNGAGKTTFLKILCGLILPDSGTVRLSGRILPFEHPSLQATFGLVTGEERSFYWRLTGRQNLKFFASFYPLSRKEVMQQIDEFSDLFHMASYLDKFFFTYSTGIKQRLGLCRGLLGNPKILLLDEPTRSLDPLAAQEWRCFLQKEFLEKKKKTILYTSHQLEEAEHFSKKIGILHGGRIIAEGGPLMLKKRVGLEESESFLKAYQKLTEETAHAS